MGKVIALHARQKDRTAPALSELVGRMRELSKDWDNVGFDHPHLQERMKQRGKTMRDVIETLTKGTGVSGPTLDKYGDYRIKVRRLVCGKRTQLIVAVRESELTVITIY